MISYGYLSLIEEFAKANNLEFEYEKLGQVNPKIKIRYKSDSDTAFSITFMSMRHLGFENMLCDYLIKCGVMAQLISVGSYSAKRDMAQLDRDWEERRKELGFR